MKKNEVYIVTAYRWGDRSCHSYNIGVFRKKAKAQKVADSHCEYRGKKYACTVEKCPMDYFDNKSEGYTEEIYRAKSQKD